MTFIIVIVLVPVILVLSVRLWIEIVQIDLIVIIGNHRLLSRWQYSSEGLCHARLKRVWEHNVELDDKSSFSKGFLYCGIPSPCTCFRSPVLITSPLTVWMTRVLSSKVLIVFLIPVRASVKLMSIFITRSDPFLLNKVWAFSSRTIIMSPGSNPGS